MSLHLDNKKKKNNNILENFYFINIFSMSSVENNKYNLTNRHQKCKNNGI